MNYKVVGRLLAASQQKVWCFSPRALSGTIVFIDAVCVILQFAGGVCATLAIAMRVDLIVLIGNIFLLTSFIIQLGLNVFFTRLLYWMYSQPQFSPSTSGTPNIGKIWWVIWSTVSLLWVRNLYRAAEGFAAVAQVDIGRQGEALFYVLDATPVFICVVIFCTWHFGLLLPANVDELTGLMLKNTARPVIALQANAPSDASADHPKSPLTNKIKVVVT
jgi:hypothetical protein